jgi:hypothetical protein
VIYSCTVFSDGELYLGVPCLKNGGNFHPPHFFDGKQTVIIPHFAIN